MSITASAGCTIVSSLETRCTTRPWYQKRDTETGEIIWTRYLTEHFVLYPNQKWVSARYGVVGDAIDIPISVEVYLGLYRQQGLGPRMLEEGGDYSTGGDFPSSQPEDVKVAMYRSDWSAGKYSFTYWIQSVYDYTEGVKIPITEGVGVDLPRFQCYDADDDEEYHQCEWPNGQEAGIF